MADIVTALFVKPRSDNKDIIRTYYYVYFARKGQNVVFEKKTNIIPQNYRSFTESRRMFTKHILWRFKVDQTIFLDILSIENFNYKQIRVSSASLHVILIAEKSSMFWKWPCLFSASRDTSIVKTCTKTGCHMYSYHLLPYRHLVLRGVVVLSSENPVHGVLAKRLKSLLRLIVYSCLELNSISNLFFPAGKLHKLIVHAITFRFSCASFATVFTI